MKELASWWQLIRETCSLNCTVGNATFSLTSSHIDKGKDAGFVMEHFSSRGHAESVQISVMKLLCMHKVVTQDIYPALPTDYCTAQFDAKLEV